MSICSSGVSQKKAGLPDDIYLTTYLLAQAISAKAPWLVDFFAYFTTEEPIHLPTFCAADPPADPGLSAADILSLIALGPGPLTKDATARAKQLIERILWPFFCECGSVATPTVTIPSAPSGLPAINPPGYVPPATAAPCYDFGLVPQDLVNQTFYEPLSGTIFTTTQTFVPIPATTTLVDISMIASLTSGASDFTHLQGAFSNSAGVRIGNNIDLSGNFTYGTLAKQITPPSGAVGLELMATRPNAPAGVTHIDLTVKCYCGGNTPGSGSSANPCLPDPRVLGLLQQILTIATLTQRQAAPFAYVPGPVHTSLTGQGEVSLSQPLLLVAELTVVPAPLGVVAGDPERIFDVGWLNPGTADGFDGPFFLTNSTQLISPRNPGVMTVCGYSLHEGVEMTLREYKAEP